MLCFSFTHKKILNSIIIAEIFVTFIPLFLLILYRLEDLCSRGKGNIKNIQQYTKKGCSNLRSSASLEKITKDKTHESKLQPRQKGMQLKHIT